VGLEQARQKLDDRIEFGKRILDLPFDDEHALKAAWQVYSNWTDYNRDLLEMMLGTDRITKEYSAAGHPAVAIARPGPRVEPALSEKVADLRNLVDWKLRSLTSLYDRLELYEAQDESAERYARLAIRASGDPIFIIHGHDRAPALELKELLEEEAGITAVLMAREPHRGRTLAEKFEEEAAECGFAFAVFTPDDAVRSDQGGEYEQMRPNVLFELGWFCGRIGRDRTCILYKTPAQIPSDLLGRGHHEFRDSVREVWLEIEQELRAAGLVG